jgi:hypothetical protein
MMAITTMDGLAAAIASGQRIVLQKASITAVANFYYSLWTASGSPGAGGAVGNIANGVIPTDATAGACIINAFNGSNTGYLMTFDASSAVAGVLSVYDRLFHSGPHLGTTLHTDTLASQPALNRVPDSNYGQLELWLEVTAVFAATATTVTVSYQDGTAAGGATQTATLDANLSGAPVQRMLPFRLANSTGVQKINSVTVGGATNTTGQFNVVIQRNIVDHTCVSPNIGRPKKGPFETGMPIIYADSCLAMMWMATTTSTGALYAEGLIGNG